MNLAQMPIGPGTLVGPYQISALLGEGGMGQGWRAHHTALKRDDALKVLPFAVAADPERLARFQREAQILASLNHPNIAIVHGLEEADGTRAAEVYVRPFPESGSAVWQVSTGGGRGLPGAARR